MNASLHVASEAPPPAQTAATSSASPWDGLPTEPVAPHETVVAQPVQVVTSQPAVHMVTSGRAVQIVSSEPAFWSEPVALLLVLGLFALLLGLILRRRRRQPAAWPVPSLLGLEAGHPEPVRLPEPALTLQDVELAPVAPDAEADEQTSEEELELVA